MITELRLVSNDAVSSSHFWSSILNAPAELQDDGQWRVTSPGGLSVRIGQAATVEAITRVDVEVACDHGAPDRLRAAGFPVSLPEFPLSAEDLNGTDGLVLLRVVGWDGISDVPWEDWSPEQIEAAMRRTPGVRDEMRTIKTVDPPAVARFLAAWFEAEQQRPEFGVRWVSVRGTVFRAEPATAPERQWVPIGARDYPAAVARVQAAGFEVVPSVTHPESAAHCDVGNVTFIVTEVST